MPQLWCLIQKLDPISGLPAKIREKSLAIKSEGFFGLRKGKMRERGRKWYKKRGKWILESRIEFPDPMLMTLDTPYCPYTKFLKK